MPKSWRTVTQDEFEVEEVEQMRVLRLVRGSRVEGRARPESSGATWWRCGSNGRGKRGRAGARPCREETEWVKVETRVPLRLGKPLPLIPFVFHGPRHSLPDVDKLPLADIIAVNLDHYRLNADYKHGLHFTALPTAWVSGFDTETDFQDWFEHGVGDGMCRVRRRVSWSSPVKG